jgi:hypothetical protein
MRIALAFTLFALGACSMPYSRDNARTDESATATSTRADLAAIAEDDFGYPLVPEDLTRRVMSNVTLPDGHGKAPMNRLALVPYWPKPAVPRGEWLPPPLERVR